MSMNHSCSDFDGFRPSFVVLISAEHYRSWFQESYDFSCFAKEEIEAYLQDTMPAEFPCIPRYGDDVSRYPTEFISINNRVDLLLSTSPFYKQFLE